MRSLSFFRGAISSFCAAYRYYFYLRQSAGRYNRFSSSIASAHFVSSMLTFFPAALVLTALLPVCSVPVLLFAPVLPPVPAACHFGGHSVPRLPPKLPPLQSKQLRKGYHLFLHRFSALLFIYYIFPAAEPALLSLSYHFK